MSDTYLSLGGVSDLNIKSKAIQLFGLLIIL